MLSGCRNNVPGGTPASVETQVLDLIAETCNLVRSELSLTMPLSELLDSLTLVAVVTRIEAAFDLALGGDETLELLAARDAGELGRLIARRVERLRANLPESTRNESC